MSLVSNSYASIIEILRQKKVSRQILVLFTSKVSLDHKTLRKTKGFQPFNGFFILR